MDAFDAQQCLVKVIGNDCWLQFVRKLKGPRFRTATSLPPPGGKGMRFFACKTWLSKTCLGLIWDRRELDLSGAFIWPSGYFAKSEFNVDENGTMRNGRKEAQVSLGDLLDANVAAVAAGQELAYNEVLLHVEGAVGLRGLFARSTLTKHLLAALGVRALLKRELPAVGELPIFVHTPEGGMRPVSLTAQRRVVEEFLADRFNDPVGLPRIPIDVGALHLCPLLQLEFHGAYGVTGNALRDVIGSLLDVGVWSSAHGGRDVHALRTSNARGILLSGFHAATDADNATSALSLLQALTPVVYLSWLQSGAPLQHKLQAEAGEDFAGNLRKLADRATSRSMFVVTSAAIVLNDLVTGRLLPRILEACRELEARLDNAKSLSATVRSVVSTISPSLSSLVPSKAGQSLATFHKGLLELEPLEESRDGPGSLGKIRALVMQLSLPCLQAEVLRQLVGAAQGRFDARAHLKALELARKVAVEAAQGAGAPPERRPSTPNVPMSEATMAPLYELEIAACAMQGVDRGDIDAEGRV